MRKASPSRTSKLPNFAWQSRIAFARMVSNTGSNSPGELEMTCSRPGEVVEVIGRILADEQRAHGLRIADVVGIGDHVGGASAGRKNLKRHRKRSSRPTRASLSRSLRRA